MPSRSTFFKICSKDKHNLVSFTVLERLTLWPSSLTKHEEEEEESKNTFGDGTEEKVEEEENETDEEEGGVSFQSEEEEDNLDEGRLQRLTTVYRLSKRISKRRKRGKALSVEA